MEQKLIDVKSMKYPAQCAKCNTSIEKGYPAKWDKENKLFWHIPHSPDYTNPKSIPKGNEPGGNTPTKDSTPLGDSIPTALTDGDILEITTKARTFAANFLKRPVIEVEHDNGLFLKAISLYSLQAEQRFAVAMTKHIQANKISNMSKIGA